ncbi:hypothetical protein OIV19_20350 [Brucella sp. HL-2]|nr:hypothetical protein [Brucella sp. HL-2]MCV9909953.1 hypothetical protein [Brucella sp. HL-2]
MILCTLALTLLIIAIAATAATFLMLCHAETMAEIARSETDAL